MTYFCVSAMRTNVIMIMFNLSCKGITTKNAINYSHNGNICKPNDCTYLPN